MIPITYLPQVLVHAAGILRVGSLGSLDMAAGQLMWQLHVDVATQLANRLLPIMQKAQYGRMIVVGSRVSSGIAGRSQYAATKAALYFFHSLASSAPLTLRPKATEGSPPVANDFIIS